MELSQEQASDHSLLDNVEMKISEAKTHKDEHLAQLPLVLASTSETSQAELGNPPTHLNTESDPRANTAERKASTERAFRSDDSISLDKSIGRITEKLSNPTTEVNTSNSRISQNRVIISEAWDNIEEYKKMKIEAQKKSKLRERGKTNNKERSGVLHTVMQMIETRDPLHFLGEATLLKIFFVSSLMLFLQLKYSKKARAWFLFTLNILLYITGLTLSAGTLTLLAVKVKKYLRRGEKKASDQIREQAPEQVSEHVNSSTQAETAVKPN